MSRRLTQEESAGAAHAAPGSIHAGLSTAVFGMQWGDEGKGKIVDLLAGEHDAVVRYNGGANAGHSIVVGGERFALHLIPAGILTPGKPCVVANGVVIDPEWLLREIDALRARGVDTASLILSDRAHVVMPYHKDEDELREAAFSPAGLPAIGTTRRGIGPAYADRAHRVSAIRMGDLLRPDVLRGKLRLIVPFKNAMLRAMSPQSRQYSADELEAFLAVAAGRLRTQILDTTRFLHDLLARGKRALFEGANATLLDVDHGTYPFVTASSASVLGVGPGTGVHPSRIGMTIGVVKAYSTRVGRGPMVTEIHDETADRIRTRGREFGTTTGRPRRIGWLDLPALKYAAMLNAPTSLAVTLLDVLGGFERLRVCVGYRRADSTPADFHPDAAELDLLEPVYETLDGFPDSVASARRLSDLHPAARAYLQFIEDYVGVPIRMVSIGPDRAQTLTIP